MKELKLILGVQLTKVKNLFFPLRKPFVIKGTLLALFVFGFEIGIYAFFNKIFSFLLGEEAFNEFFVLYLVERLMGMVFLMVFAMLIFSNILSALSVIYLSKDLPMLISSPLRVNKVFLAKFISSTVISSYTVILIMIPIFLSYAKSFQTGLFFLIPSLTVLILFIIFSSGLGTLMTVTLMRFFPAKRTHQVVMVSGLIMLIMLISVVRMMRPERLLQPAGGSDFAKVLESITVSSVGYFPGTWASKAILGAGQANFNIFWKGFFPLLLTAIFMTLFVYLLAKKIYYRSWAMSGIARRGGKTRRSMISLLSWERVYRPFPHGSRPLMVKDTLLFFRDTTQWSQLLILAGLVFIYLLNVKSLPLTSVMLKNLPARALLSYLNLAFMGFIIATVVARFGYPAVSFEAKSVWIIRSLPINFRQYLWTKFVMFYFPLLGMSMLLMFLSNKLLEIPALAADVSLAVIALITFGLTGLGVGLGAAYPKFKYESPAQIITGLGGLIFMVISLVYIAVIVILMAIPGYQYFAYITSGRVFVLWPSYVAIFIVLALSIAIAVIPMEFGLKKWKRYQI